MSERIVGKLSPTRMQALIAGHVGASCPGLKVGPGPGLDAAILEMSGGRVMAVAEDPIFPAPGLPLEIMGWFTVHIGASDVAVTGVRPQFISYTLLLPTASPVAEAETIVAAISETARDLGISIVGGHTGWYDAVAVPLVGGVTVWGFAGPGEWISPGGARPGDALLMTKGPAIEATALLGILYRARLQGQMPPALLERACARNRQITVVPDAMSAFAAGGVHAMHDATEGGVLGGLWEMAAASGLAVQADLDQVPVPDDVAALAGALDFDPWQAISEGTLLAAVSPESVPVVLATWQAEGIPGWEIGRFLPGPARVTVTRHGRAADQPEPKEDPFWRLFFAGLG